MNFGEQGELPRVTARTDAGGQEGSSQLAIHNGPWLTNR